MSRGGRQDERDGALEPDGEDLVGLLYGELDGEAERSLRARVAADSALAGHLAELVRVREVLGSLPDEEPPSHLTAQLLSQAAQTAQRSRRAPQAEARRGFWSRVRAWLQPLAAHPGLAAAASIVLLVGVASALLVRKGDELTRAPASEDSAAMPEPASRAATAPAASTPEPPRDPPDPSAAPATLNQELAADSTDRVGGAARDQASPPAQEARGASRQRVAKKSAPAPASAADRFKSEPAPEIALGLTDGKADTAPRPRAKTPAGPAGSSAGSPAGSSAGAPAGSSVGSASEPAPSSAAEAEEANEERAASRAGTESGRAADKPEPPAAQAPPPSSKAAPASPEELHKRAITAASDRRCLQVQSLDQEIRRIDPAYHERVVRSDKRLAACLAAKRAK